MKKRIMSLLLCISILLGLLPLSGFTAVDTKASELEFNNYGTNIGNTAEFNNYYPIPVTDKPEGIKNPWGTECQFVSESDNVNQLKMVVTDYYCSADGNLWYKVKAAPGYDMPEKLLNYPWVYQDNVTSPMGDSVNIHSSAQSYVFDENGNPASSVVMSAYDEIELNCKTTLQGKKDYQWQIHVSGEWVDIRDEESSDISVNVGMLLSAIDDNNTALVRCVSEVGSKSVVSEPISITVDSFDPQQLMTLSLDDYAVQEVADEADEYRYVTVMYLFENGTEAENPFVAKVLKDEELNVTVEFPTVQGYLPYYQEEQLDFLTIDGVITDDVTFTVYYKPTDVEYSIDIYFQNIADDNYTFQETRTLTGLTGTLVPHITVSYDGMYELLHETPAIAANGSTHLEVYFNRIYYLTQIELDGGYGVYSVYARYGADLANSIGTPIKPGHTFIGWDNVTDGSGDGIADVMDATVPAKEQVYKALWKMNPTAEVRVAYWGENPNDEGYSYIESKSLYVKPGIELTYSSTGNICGLEAHTHGNNCVYKCGLENHTHVNDCYTLICGFENHTHVDDCYDCHKHSKTCYPDAGDKVNSNPWRAPSDPSEGQIYRINRNNIYIYINGSWYRYEKDVSNETIIQPLSCTHEHNADCPLKCGQEEHSHTGVTGACYKLTCGKVPHAHDNTCTDCIAHQHSNSCRIGEFEDYSSSKWKFVKSDTVTVVADGSTVLNVYFDRTTFTMTFKKTKNNGGTTLGTISDKWGADIRNRFQAMCTANTFLWSATSDGGSPWTSFLDVMPSENRTYYAYTTTSTNEQVATYYGQDLDGNYSIVLFTSKVKYGNNLTVSKEEFVEIEGYEFNESKSTKTGSNFNGAEFYYDRASFRLEFYNGTDLEREESVKYEASLAEFNNYVPKFPSDYEPGSREFAGWYLNPEFTGDKVDLTKMTMGTENMALYAKWDLVRHDVHIYKEKFDDGTFGDPVLGPGIQPDPVLHGSKVFETDFTIPIPENKPYSFIGWFYMDGDTERMWDFEHSIVVKDTDIYAKWSAEVLVPYTIRFVVKNADGSVTEIADAISSSALAGTTVTFNAKGGGDLYDGYETGYFPITTSHSLTMDVHKSEEGMFYDFEYVAKSKVPYTVRYVDENGEDLITPKVVTDNTYAIVTEKFVYIPDYAPDKYQKTLILNGADGAVNEIVFQYKKDSTLGVYNVTHYIQSTDGENYIEHTSYGDIGTVGELLEIAPLEIKGFTYHRASVNGSPTELTNGTVNGTINKEGLELKLFYKRNKYPYKIQYLDKDTSAVLKEPYFSKEEELQYYGTTVTETNPPLIENYDFSSVNSCVIKEDTGDEPTVNVINVYYTEKTVKITYEVVGPEGCGTVTPEYTDVKIISGTGAASEAKANADYRFVGWYLDSECTQLVTADTMLRLTIPDDKIWKAATYYAKFEPQVSDLTIVKTNAADSSQVFVYEVKNTDGEIIYVSVVGNSQVTIHDLPMGEYTVKQLNNWSWRYGDGAIDVDHHSVTGSTVTFTGGEVNSKWLNGNSNIFKNRRGQ